MSEEKKQRFQICVPVPQIFRENVDKQMRKKAYEEDRKVTYIIMLEEALNAYFGVDLTVEDKPKKKKRKVEDDE